MSLSKPPPARSNYPIARSKPLVLDCRHMLLYLYTSQVVIPGITYKQGYILVNVGRSSSLALLGLFVSFREYNPCAPVILCSGGWSAGESADPSGDGKALVELRQAFSAHTKVGRGQASGNGAQPAGRLGGRAGGGSEARGKHIHTTVMMHKTQRVSRLVATGGIGSGVG